jgi:hypothetical protein
MQAEGEVKGMYIVVLTVVLMMVGMIFLVQDMKESTELKKKEDQVAIDSLVNLKFEQLMAADSTALYNDSITQEVILSQAAEIEQLKTQVSNIKYKLNALAE